MSQASESSAQLDASLVWQQLSERIDRFAAAWESGDSPPQLGDFLPTEHGTLRRLTLAEAVKIDLEYRWQREPTGKLVEDYLAEFPELAVDGNPPCDIIYEEFHIRKLRGDSVSAQEYCLRFPRRAVELARLLHLEGPAQTTVLTGKERMPTFEVGQRVDDFDLLKPLGRGAFASVFLARQFSMMRLVALKISRDRGNEPQTLAQLEHPHIVRVYDQRRLDIHKLRLLYMEYVAGGTLLDVVAHARQVPPAARRGATMLQAVDQSLERNGEQPPQDSLTRYRLQNLSWAQTVCWFGARLAGALAYAHARGILHRDIKPANVLVAADGHPKLADFNISFSKIDGATPAAYFGGSLAYMSPEQLEAFDPAHARQPEELDHRSDIYSLGVVLWELLIGRRPFDDQALAAQWGQSLDKMTKFRRGGLPPDAVAAASTYPRLIVAALAKCLAPNPDDRYATAAQLARELDLCLQPRAHALLRGGVSWGALAKRYPVTSTIALGLIPNVALCGVNIPYNWIEILKHLSSDDQRVFVQFQLTIVNLVAYSIGLGYVLLTRGKMFRTVSRLAAGEKMAIADDGRLAERCLTLGIAAAGISAILWAISGFVFPAWMQLHAGESSMIEGDVFRHFLVSNLLCGLIAATQTYFVATLMSVRYCFPWLLAARGEASRETETRGVEALARVANRGRVMMALAVVAPFLALPAFVLINFKPAVIGGLGLLGLIGCGIAYLLESAIRADVAALAAALNPSGDPLLASDTVESFLTGSRR